MLAACLSAAASAAPPRVSRRVAVIGGGSGGLAAARFLQRAGHRPVLFEAGASLGGVWAEAPTNDVVYQRLQTNLPTVVMQSPDLDFPAGTRSYVSKRELGAYIARYAAEFGGAAAARLGCVVTRVRLEGGGGAEARWRVEWTCGEEACSDVFDAVAVANGHYDKPYEPEVRGQREWLAADSARSVLHSRAYDDAEAFRGEAVLVVGGRSSGVDIARQLHGVAAWVYVLEKKCAAPRTDAGLRVTHVPLGARLAADGRVYLGDEPVGGPAVQRLLLATGYCYSFPFLDEAELGMSFEGRRLVTPLYQHLLHARLPTLGFVGIPLAVPCPIPFFECQAAFLAEHWARPAAAPLTSEDERLEWVARRLAAVGERTQDMHFTSAAGGCPWSYMRELIARARAARAQTSGECAARGSESWLEGEEWDARLRTVEEIYRDRGSRYPTLPWEDDAYRRCEYSVDWASGRWTVVQGE